MNFGWKLLKILKHPVNIICVKTGTKYTKEDVQRLHKMVKRNCTLPFIFYCLTDNLEDLPDDVIGVVVDQELDLEAYWWKISLFNLGWTEQVLYMDLDVIIQNNIDYIFEDVNSKNLKCLSIIDAGIYYPFDGTAQSILTIPITNLNTSIMLFNPKDHQELYNKFVSNIDYNIIHYYGLDRFIYNESQALSFFDFSKDYYFRAKGQESYDTKYIDSNGFINDPRKTFCILNQSKPEHYAGLEKYLI